jgi:hypothetical protein
VSPARLIGGHWICLVSFTEVEVSLKKISASLFPAITSFLFLLPLGGYAYSDEIPADCLASFAVADSQLDTNLDWILATGANATMSCTAAELLREGLFVEGPNMLTEGDLDTTPTEAQQKALAAFKTLQDKAAQMPDPSPLKSLLPAGAYLVTKYQLAMCILTVEAEGGSCWIAAGKHVAGMWKFFGGLYKDQQATINKQQFVNALQNLKPVLSGLQPGQADPGGARDRWVRTQTQLCRAIKQGCLQN